MTEDNRAIAIVGAVFLSVTALVAYTILTL